MLISVVIPSFNEEEVITESYRRLAKVFADNNLPDFELIFITTEQTSALPRAHNCPSLQAGGRRGWMDWLFPA